MRAVTWNLAHKKPDRFRGLVNRRRQWAALGALNPDVAFLQECTASDLSNLAPAWMTDEYEIIGRPKSQWRGSAAILVRRSLEPQEISLGEIPEVQQWHDALRENVAVARLALGEAELIVASVYADARHAVNPALTDADHDRVRRPSEKRAWTSDWLAAALDPIVDGRAFLVGGDWNEARLFDTDPAFGQPSAHEFFAARDRAGWHDVMRLFSETEVRTFLDSTRPFELDHLFSDPRTASSITECRVLDEPILLELSDHAIVTCRLA